MKRTVLLTFGRSFLSLACARVFAAAGYRVVAIDSVDFSLSRYSNSVDAFYRVQSPGENPNGYIDDLLAIVAKEHVDLLVPMWEDICHVAHAKERFPKNCTIFCPDFNTYHELLNKWTFQQLLSRLHIEHPKTVLVTKKEDLQNVDFKGTYALKPAYSRASQHIMKTTPGSSLPNIEIFPHNPWVAQEWIEGKSYCSYSVCRDGRVLAHALYPVRYTVDGHSCLSFQYVEHPGILEWVNNIVSKIGFTGQIAFDFIETKEGILHAIECNPRATSGLFLFQRNQGLDRAFFGAPEKMLTPNLNASRQIATGMAMFGWKKKSNYSKKISGFLRDFFTTPDVVLSKRDPLPFFMQPFIFTQIYWGSLKTGMSVPDFFIDDHIWDGNP